MSLLVDLRLSLLSSLGSLIRVAATFGILFTMDPSEHMLRTSENPSLGTKRTSKGSHLRDVSLRMKTPSGLIRWKRICECEQWKPDDRSALVR